MGVTAVAIVLLLCVFVGLSTCHEADSERNISMHRASAHIVISGGPEEPPSANGPTRTRTLSLQPLTPQQIIAAYNSNYNATGGAGKVIAIIDAFGASSAESDLAQFTAQFGLPACTTANGCFKKIDQTGGTNYPADDATSNWGMEVALDIQAAHAMAPGAKKVLIVAKSSSLSDLFTAVKYAVNTLKANYISMSWGGAEGSYISTYESIFASTSAYFASTGDAGSSGGVEYPSTSAHVIAVGGTSLYTNSAGGYSEQGWSGSTGGCSAYVTAISAQSSLSGYSSLGCSGKKAVPDASLLADPNSGMYIYYSGLNNGSPACTAPNCWFKGGGTSLAAPLLAARAAARAAMMTPTSVYSGGYTYRDITIGTNGGFTCLPGEDLVTGVGSLLG